MKFLTSVKEVPATRNGKGKHTEFWRALDDTVNAMPNGDWLPIECEDVKEASRIGTACNTKTRFDAKVRGNTVYVRKAHVPTLESR